MATFLEGLEAIAQACTLVLLLPAVALALVARARSPIVVGGYLLGATLLMWGKAAGYWTLDNRGAIVVVIAAGAGATFLAAWRSRRSDGSALIAAGIVGGAIAGWLWQPCVGPQLGDILNSADTEGARTLGLMMLYVAGALVPAALVAALPHAVPRARSIIEHEAPVTIGLLFGVAYTVTIAVGRYDDFVGELFRISSN